MAYSLTEVRAALVIGGIPSLGHSGSTLASWTILEQLLEAGHEVDAVLLPAAELVDETAPARYAAIERLGATVHVVEIPPARPPEGRWRGRLDLARSLAAPRDDELFPAVRARPAVATALEGAESGIAFGIEAIAATADLPGFATVCCKAGGPPLLAVLSHPPGV